MCLSQPGNKLDSANTRQEWSWSLLLIPSAELQLWLGVTQCAQHALACCSLHGCLLQSRADMFSPLICTWGLKNWWLQQFLVCFSLILKPIFKTIFFAFTFSHYKVLFCVFPRKIFVFSLTHPLSLVEVLVTMKEKNLNVRLLEWYGNSTSCPLWLLLLWKMQEMH